MKKNLRPTYISLFSSAGVGCYGFKMEGFDCVATNELLSRRMEIQKYNQKCKYESGYICGDITNIEIQRKLYSEIDFWKNNEGLSKVDVVIATPPCQGMSTANYKKGDETNRNSLVVEAIHIVKNIKPRIFVFENVKAFLKTICVDKDKEIGSIQNCIFKNLADEYNIFAKVVNFMDYGVPSSRPRTIVIGTLKSEMNFTPLNIFPLKQERIVIKEVIGDLKSLNYGEYDDQDFLHSFRIYPKYMQEWIHDLKEGETAFKNVTEKLPYKIVNGEKQLLKSGHMGNKFRRMFWNQPAPCITTRNDQLASQSTIHPTDDRVLSIRELMRVMTIPDSFNWVPEENYTRDSINSSETLIRQSIGEAVPTKIMQQIAENILDMLEYDLFIKNESYKKDVDILTDNFYINSLLFEKKLSNVKETGSFYTPQIVVYNTIKEFKPDKEKVSLLEPSVGMGAFIPQILRLTDDCTNVNITCVDSSEECINALKQIIGSLHMNKKFKIKYICHDFLTYNFEEKFDAVLANPPYFKMKSEDKKKYRMLFENLNDNIFCLFLKKIQQLSDEVMTVIPKTFIMIPDCNDVRMIYQEYYNIVVIYDYGVKYFKDVFIEILSIHFKTNYTNNMLIYNLRDNECNNVEQGYIYHYKQWLLYRNKWFDNYIEKLSLGVFDFYRDRQLTNKYLSSEKKKIWVVRSKNLLDNGQFIHKQGYDKYVDSLDGFMLKNYFNKESIIFSNFTYNTRAAILPEGCIVNGSFCILLPKDNITNIDLNLYSTESFRKYYSIVKNKSRFTINVDSNCIYYIEIKK